MKKALTLTLLLLLAALGSGCAASKSAKLYDIDDARRTLDVSYATVVATREAVLQDKYNSGGALSGALTGGMLGYAVGGGMIRPFFMASGAVIGLIAGPVVERHLKQRRAYEIELRFDNDKTAVIVQDADLKFSPGERVRVVREPNGEMRVRHLS